MYYLKIRSHICSLLALLFGSDLFTMTGFRIRHLRGMDMVIIYDITDRAIGRTGGIYIRQRKSYLYWI